MTSGIYRIVNKINGKSYIGCSKNIEIRFSKHIWFLKNNRHENRYLQNSWNKYGEDNFEFQIVELCPEEIIFDRETCYLNEAIKDSDSYYNLNFENTRPPSPKGRIVSPQTRKLLSDLRKGENGPMFGKKHSVETRNKMSASRSKKVFSFLNPENIKVEITNLKKFCRENRLNDGGMYNVYNGRISHYKGWKKLPSQNVV